MKKWLRWTLGIPLVLSLLVGALWWQENRRGRRIWEETSARLRAAGEPVELADIVPPPIPDEDNVAAAPIFAELFDDKDRARLTKYAEAFSGMSPRETRPPAKPLLRDDMSALDEWRDFLRACSPTKAPANPSPAADEIQNHFSAWANELREMREALQRPKCRWPLAYEDGIRMENPALVLPAALCSNARPQVLASAAQGDAAACTDTILTHLHLVRSMSEGSPYLIAQLVAITGDAIMLQTLQHVLTVVHFDEGQLAALQNQISRISLRDMARAFQCERVVGANWMRHVTLQDMRVWFDAQHAIKAISVPVEIHWAGRNLLELAMANRPEGWKLADGADYAAFLYDEVQPCVDESAGTVLRSQAITMDLAHTARKKAARPWSFMKVSDSFGHMLRMAANHQALAREALLWCAIERFRLKHQNLPDKLADLAPEFIDKIPCDPVNGLPLRYVRKAERNYLLYSIGWNGKDDSGVEAKSRHQGDWVWASDPKLIMNVDVERERAAEAADNEREAKRKAKKPRAQTENAATPEKK